MRTGAAIFGFVFSGAIGLAIGYSMGSGTRGTQLKVAEKVKVGPEAGEPTEQVEVFKVPLDDSPARGGAAALVTIVEFSDFECPFCKQAVGTLTRIEDVYKDKVRVVFKHLPLPLHEQAALAAEYAVAAADQGKFWEMHDKLFFATAGLAPAQLDAYAQEIGLDQAKLKALIESGEARKIVSRDQDLASRLGATGTPTFFINGVRLSGAQPYTSFQRIIDEQIAKAEDLLRQGAPKLELYARLTEGGLERAQPPAPRPDAPTSTRQPVKLIDGTPGRGGQAALVTIVEFGDFQCPYCARSRATLEQVLETYGDKVAVHFRQLPLEFHERAEPAARAALAALRQGRFWEMHDKLYDNQGALSDQDFERYAKELELDMDRFRADLQSAEVSERLKKDIADARSYGAQGTPAFFVNGVPIRGAQPFNVFAAVIEHELELAEQTIARGTPREVVYEEILANEVGKPVPEIGPGVLPPSEPQKLDPSKIDLGQAPFLGPKNAPVKMIVYSDFECPFCSRLTPVIEELKKDYKGKILIAFKHFPLPFHRNAELAAIASLAAHRQGKFWEMHEKLFANQGMLVRERMIEHARGLGLDTARFENDLDDPALRDWVKNDIAEGERLGVRGTPAVFINGKMVAGAKPVETFKEMIDAELKRKS